MASLKIVACLLLVAVAYVMANNALQKRACPDSDGDNCCETCITPQQCMDDDAVKERCPIMCMQCQGAARKRLLNVISFQRKLKALKEEEEMETKALRGLKELLIE